MFLVQTRTALHIHRMGEPGKVVSLFGDKSQFHSVLAAKCNSVGEPNIIKALVTRIRPRLCDTHEPLYKVFGTPIATMTSLKWELCDAGALGASCSRWELTLSSSKINALDLSFFYPYVTTETKALCLASLPNIMQV